jgi:hypothetical protein
MLFVQLAFSSPSSCAFAAISSASAASSSSVGSFSSLTRCHRGCFIKVTVRMGKETSFCSSQHLPFLLTYTFPGRFVVTSFSEQSTNELPTSRGAEQPGTHPFQNVKLNLMDVLHCDAAASDFRVGAFLHDYNDVSALGTLPKTSCFCHRFTSLLIES